MALVILVFVVLWNYDLHKILHVKGLSQNGGDAAAVMAARWQGITLNLIGDLNIMQALAITSGDSATSSAITNIQARLCYVGPMIGFMASQQAAKNNGIYSNPEFTQLLEEHARKVREDYGDDAGSGEALFPPPYPGCWEEYAQMLELVAMEGVAVGPDNVRYYGDAIGGHILLDMGFYDAVAAKAWCWFYHHAPNLLDDYTDYRWWPPLPEITHRHYMNSEIFGLGLTKVESALTSFTDTNTFAAVASERGFAGGPSAEAADTPAVWYCYGGGAWAGWDAMNTSGPDRFPLTGPVRPQYDYSGADAAIRVVSETGRLTPGAGGDTITNTITWTSAAKPFGHLNEADRPNQYSLVLPAFREARLIPVDAASSGSGGGYDLEWRHHIEEHLPEYLQHGPQPYNCRYCASLRTWELPAFRAEGRAWLKVNWRLCTLPGGGGGGGGGPGPGGGRSGGARRGH